MFGVGNDLELGFDSIVLNLFDGTIDTLFRPDDWNYDDYDRNKSNNNYDYNWILEEDVFIPQVETIHKINSKYTGDLLTQSNGINKNGIRLH